MNSDKVMVCVTKQITCERLIHYGKTVRDKIDGQLHIIHVAGEGNNFLDNEEESEALEYLFGISNMVGANLTVLRSNNIEATILDFVNDNNISHIVFGETNSEEGIVKRLREKLNNCYFHVISQNEIYGK